MKKLLSMKGIILFFLLAGFFNAQAQQKIILKASGANPGYVTLAQLAAKQDTGETFNFYFTGGTLYTPNDSTLSTKVVSATDTGAVTPAMWDGKQDALVSGTNIKTINGTSVLGSGNITVTASMPTVNQGEVLGNNTTSGTATPVAIKANGVVLASGTVTAGTDVTFNLSTYAGSYDYFEVEFPEWLPSTQFTQWQLLFSSDGTTFDGSNNLVSVGGSQLGQASISNAGMSNVNASGGTIKIYTPTNTSYRPRAIGHLNIMDGSENLTSVAFAASVNGTSTLKNITHVRFNQSGGTVTCKYVLKGFKL